MDDLRNEFELIMRTDWAETGAANQKNHEALDGFLPQAKAEIQHVYSPLVQKVLGQIQEQTEATTSTNSISVTKPFILGITGGVSVGKSSSANILERLFRSQESGIRVEVLSTDGFLYPNRKLLDLGIMHRKGFPESFDYQAIVTFLSSVKSSSGKLKVPLYSHATYDVVDAGKTIENPDILIIEGLNLLQNDPSDLNGENPTIRDFIDLCVFLNAKEKDMKDWYVSRFLDLCNEGKNNKDSFFNRYSGLSEEGLTKEAKMIWNAINSPNLRENIFPVRSRADLILFKERDHVISKLALKKN